MSSESQKLKRIHAEVTRLKLLSPTSDPPFKLERSPFRDDDDDDEGDNSKTATPKSAEPTIEGLVYPNSETYKAGAFRIEIKIIATFPFDAPEVRFLTKIYHPNIDKEGKFCHELLKKKAKWTATTTLVDVVRAVIAHIDMPDIEYSLSLDLGTEYMQNRLEFERKALEFVKQHAIPRS
ncbi:unnamed protein product [Adineta ricciae]|uniref:UBC core domain-containing protein n=1 Tax=Adineta ricciae TaxID=249248 RepID=A0A815GJW4_ADIRI|nr:unnamed protein product [Adineta ricciae]